MPGGWLAVLAGAWYVVGNQLAPLLGIGSVGDPIAEAAPKRSWRRTPAAGAASGRNAAYLRWPHPH